MNYFSKEKVISDIDVLLTQLTASKDAIGTAIDQLCDDGIFSEILFHTVTRSHKIFPALGGFISNVLVKIANRKPWKSDPNLWLHFVRCAVANAPHSYFVSFFNCNEELYLVVKKFLLQGFNTGI